MIDQKSGLSTINSYTINCSQPQPWEKLFAPAEEPAASTRRFGVVRRHGQVFLLLPSHGRLAAKALELYAAQSPTARLGKSLLRFALRCGYPFLEPMTLRISTQDPFTEYLGRAAGIAGKLAHFALLAGNPQTPGQRFIFLVFDDDGKPAAVVKAGHEVESIRLIDLERNFLKSIPKSTVGVPIMRSEFTSDRLQAFSMDYLPGDAPESEDWAMVEKVLVAWVQPWKARIAELGSWRRFESAQGGPSLPRAVQKLGALEVNPCIFHGDFAPWNIKNSAGIWTLVDWERGELEGIPSWDWFHFLVQTEILVRKASATKVLSSLEALFAQPEFARYAGRTGITGSERPLALAYVEYYLSVLRPSEGASEWRQLGAAMKARWFPEN